MRVETISDSAATRPAAEAPADHVATFRARVGGYVVDMVIFAAIAMLTLVLAGFVLLLRTDWATESNTSDADFYTFIAIIGLGTPIFWSALNLALLATRSQTGGQYVAGLRLAREDGSRVSASTAAGWWFAFNPLLYSWPMALVAGAPLAALVALVANVVSLFFLALVVLLCVAAPIAAFVSALIDAQNRALHDRVVGTIVAPVDAR
jgi:uncharacterized RDD family membrane protein YckC